jgi:hypothetical protein
MLYSTCVVNPQSDSVLWIQEGAGKVGSGTEFELLFRDPDLTFLFFSKKICITIANLS